MPYSYPKYPGAIFDDTDFPDQADDVSWIKAWLTNALKEELQACLTELGTNPKGVYASVKARLEAIKGGGHITILPFSYNSIGQGTWAISLVDTYWTYGIWFNSTNADEDNISYKVYLAKGTYKLLMLGSKHVSSAIVDIDIDATEVDSFDWYAADTVHNFRHVKSDISIATSGLKTLKIRVDGHHASSSGYHTYFQYIALWRTE